MINNSKIISIDAETDGLRGNAFAIGCQVYEYYAPVSGNPTTGQIIDRWVKTDQFYGCLHDYKNIVTNQWVKENVFPTLILETTHDDYESLLFDFSEFFNKNKSAQTIWHMGHVVETHLFRECVCRGYIGEWDAPYTPIEISTMLNCHGYRADSVDEYAKENDIQIIGTRHNPLFDCEVAANVYFSLLKKNI